MLNCWEIVQVYRRVKAGKWRLLSEGVGHVDGGRGWLSVDGYDGTNLYARFDNLESVMTVIVSLADGTELLRVRCAAVESIASMVEIDSARHSAQDMVSVMSYSAIVYHDQEYGYIGDALSALCRGSCVAVFEFSDRA